MDPLPFENVTRELDHLFRKEAGRMIAVLTKVFGPSQLDLAETVVQDALLKATQVWPYSGIPENPAGWIMQVAKNRALDIIRRDRLFISDQSVLDLAHDPSHADSTATALFESEIQDDQLRLIFICCHPVVPFEARIALTLKTICGFGVAEIARAFLAKEETIAQRLVRAKQKIRAERLAFELPEGATIGAHLDGVLETIYLLFNEGYTANGGDTLIRKDMCYEACRLGRLLAKHPSASSPKVHALVALMLLQASRLNARVDSIGEVILLEDQEREMWDQGLISEGLHHLSEAAAGKELSNFHLLAGISACHATARNFDQTDWPRILGYYDLLVGADPSPVLALNRSVAVSFIEGPAAALKLLREIGKAPAMAGYYLFPATKADFYRRLDDREKAATCYREALKLSATAPEKRFLLRRLKELETKN